MAFGWLWMSCMNDSIFNFMILSFYGRYHLLDCTQNVVKHNNWSTQLLQPTTKRKLFTFIWIFFWLNAFFIGLVLIFNELIYPFIFAVVVPLFKYSNEITIRVNKRGHDSWIESNRSTNPKSCKNWINVGFICFNTKFVLRMSPN